MPEPLDQIALVYSDDAYRETTQPGTPAVAGGPMGLMGRQVAGKEFLDALLDHGRWSNLLAVIDTEPSARSLQQHWQQHWAAHGAAAKGEKKLRIVDWRRGWDGLLRRDSLSRTLHFAGPPRAEFAWARSACDDPAAFALTGVTHTLSTSTVMANLCDLVTAPFESFDALVCTSRAAADVVRRVTGTYGDYLADRLGAATTPKLRPHIATIPLGVDPALYRPPTPAERAAKRAALGIADDEVVVLFVGRLTFHGKAHPFPMYAALDGAARRAGRKVRLILSGWAPNADTRTAFVNGAAAFAPNVRTSFVDSLSAEMRYAIWHAADVFTSLSDNLQETFGLSVIQAMSCGLPVVATDWNGYRDLVADGETGLLVPTASVRDATADATSKLLLGRVSYDEFLGECSQATAVDVAAAAVAYERLITDDALRTRMGASARARVEERFTWASVVRAYEQLWADQEAERVRWAASADSGGRGSRGPAVYPAVDHSFAVYPSSTLDETTVVVANTSVPPDRVERLLVMALTGYLPAIRCMDAAVIRRLIDAAGAAGCAISTLDAMLGEAGVTGVRARATIAWMLKYDLLRIGEEARPKR